VAVAARQRLKGTGYAGDIIGNRTKRFKGEKKC
jgi:hypothetical protein